MAIQQVGESLLSDIRKRNQQEAKRLRKEEEKQAILGLGVSLAGMVGNNILESKVQNFMTNENTLKDRVMFKTNYTQAEKDVTEYNNYLSNGFQYLYDQALAPVTQAIKLAAPAGASQTQMNQLIHNEAMKRAKEAENNLKARYDSASKFIQSAGADPMAYDKALLKQQPRTVAEYITKGIGGLFSGGNATTALDKSNSEFLKDKATSYQTLRQENIGPKPALDLVQHYQDTVDWQKAPPKIETKEITVSDEFGNDKKITGQLLTDSVTGKSLGFYDLNGNPVNVTTGEFGLTKRRIQSIPQESIDQVQMDVMQNVSQDTLNVFKTYTEEVLVNKSEDKERITAAKKQVYGEILVSSKALQKRFNFTDDVAIQLASEMQAINIQNKIIDTSSMFNPFENLEVQPGKDLFLTKDTYSPFLALAALEKLEKQSESGERIPYSKKTLENIRTKIMAQTLSESGQAEMGRVFTNMSDMSKKNYFDWMSGYDIFTSPIGQAQTSILDRFKMAYAPQVKLEKDKPIEERLPSMRSF